MERNKKKIYWSPSVKWNKLNGLLDIEIFEYNKEYSDLFPEFYFYTQKGISEVELIKKFKSFNQNKLKIFINDLKEKRILVNSILTPGEIFYPQGIFFRDIYDEKLLIDAQKLSEYKKEKLNRSMMIKGHKTIKLETEEELPKQIVNRRSQRKFNRDDKISFDNFSYLAEVYEQKRRNNEVFYNYASAGGLYPIDIYYYIKKDRVENIDEGLYYYDPVNSELRLINGKIENFEDCHYYNNKQIFLSSAYSILFVYDAEASFAKYGSNAYYYAILDLGIMIELYTTIAESKNIGICSIGEMNFENIKEYFNLCNNQVYLHTIEIGLKDN